MPIVSFISMRTVSKSRLKSHMLELFREVERTGEGIIVTDHGRPTLRVEPIEERFSVETLFADVRGKMVYHADIMEPETDEWSDL
jgi:prevent-host-death family protein